MTASGGRVVGAVENQEGEEAMELVNNIEPGQDNVTVMPMQLSGPTSQAIDSDQNCGNTLQAFIQLQGLERLIEIAPTSSPTDVHQVNFQLSNVSKDNHQGRVDNTQQSFSDSTHSQLSCQGLMQEEKTVCKTSMTHLNVVYAEEESCNTWNTIIKPYGRKKLPNQKTPQTVTRTAPKRKKKAPVKPEYAIKKSQITGHVHKRPYRDRVIHLLALKDYKKLELLVRLKKDGIHKKDRNSLGKILQQVATLNPKTLSYSLKDYVFKELQRDWPGYDESDRQSLDLVLARKLDLAQNVAASNHPESSRSSSTNGMSPQKQLLHSTFIDPLRKKVRISHLTTRAQSISNVQLSNTSGKSAASPLPLSLARAKPASLSLFSPPSAARAKPTRPPPSSPPSAARAKPNFLHLSSPPSAARAKPTRPPPSSPPSAARAKPNFLHLSSPPSVARAKPTRPPPSSPPSAARAKPNFLHLSSPPSAVRAKPTYPPLSSLPSAARAKPNSLHLSSPPSAARAKPTSLPLSSPPLPISDSPQPLSSNCSSCCSDSTPEDPRSQDPYDDSFCQNSSIFEHPQGKHTSEKLLASISIEMKYPNLIEKNHSTSDRNFSCKFIVRQGKDQKYSVETVGTQKTEPTRQERSADSGSSEGVRDRVTHSCPTSQESCSTSGPSGYLNNYCTIVSLEQRQRYAQDFRAEYDEYRALRTKILTLSSPFINLDAKMKHLTPGTKEYDDVSEEMSLEYRKLKQSNPNFIKEKERFRNLYNKLAHIKRLVHDFDQKQVESWD